MSYPPRRFHKSSNVSIATAMKQCGSYAGTARLLGVSREFIRDRCKKMGIESSFKQDHGRLPKRIVREYVRKPASPLTGIKYDPLKGAMSELMIEARYRGRRYDDVRMYQCQNT